MMEAAPLLTDRPHPPLAHAAGAAPTVFPRWSVGTRKTHHALCLRHCRLPQDRNAGVVR